MIRQLRREVEEGKRRLTELLGEVSDLRRERDAMRVERGDNMVK